MASATPSALPLPPPPPKGSVLSGIWRQEAGLELDPSPLRRKLDRIVDQVEQYLGEAVAVGQGRGETFGDLVPQLHPFFDCLGSQGGEGPFGGLDQGYGFDPEPYPARLQVGELQQVVQEPSHPSGVAEGDLQETAGVLSLFQGSLQQRLQVPSDGSQGGPKLMGYVSHELLPHAFQTPQLGQVVEHQDGAPTLQRIPQGCRIKLEDLRGAREERGPRQLPADRNSLQDSGFQELSELLVSNQFAAASADQILSG